MQIDIDHVATDIATAWVVSPEYVDYLHLVKTSRGGKIAKVLFRNGQQISPNRSPSRGP